MPYKSHGFDFFSRSASLANFFNPSFGYTVPTAKIISDKNARAWVSMVSYLKKKWKYQREKKILGAA